jgi:hypothetical protein
MSGMVKRLVSSLGLGALVGSLVAAGVLGAGAASASSTFMITKLVPNPIVVVNNGPHKNLTIDWAGTATFPITAHYVPEPGCSHSGGTCYPGSYAFKTGTHALVWKGAAWCFDAPPGWKGGKWYVYLVDAHGTKTPEVTLTLVCKR